MSRTLDLDRLWERAAERGLQPQALARRAGMRPAEQEVLLHLSGLHELTARQLVAIADVLEVTVDELLTVDPPPPEPGSTDPEQAESDGRMPAARIQVLVRTVLEALLRFGSLAEATLMTALSCRPTELDSIIAALQRGLEHSDLKVRRACGRLELTVRHRGSQFAIDRLTDVQTQQQALSAQQTPSLISAVRAHLVAPLPGPPLVPWHTADPLIRQGAALPPAPDEVAGRPVRLVPHPDLLFALHLADRPADETPPSGQCEHHSPPPSADESGSHEYRPHDPGPPEGGGRDDGR